MKNWFGALILLWCLGDASAAQTPAYPDHPITLVITSVPGGVTDVVGRALGQELTKAWGQQVIVENKGGAAHIIGAEAVAKAVPDGYTLLVGESGTFTVNPTLYPKDKLPYDPDKDFIPITGLVRINQALLADRALPVANAAELIALAKQKPGQLTYGTAGVGSALHMNMELFDSMAGIKLVAVHYRGSTPALNDLIGTKFKIVRGFPGSPPMALAMERGEVDAIGGMSWEAIQLTKQDWLIEKKAKGLYTHGAQRIKDLPQVPGLIDLAVDDKSRRILGLMGGGPDIGRSLVAEPGIPGERAAALRKAFTETMEDPEFVADMHKRNLGVEPLTGEEVQKIVATAVATPRELVEQAARYAGQ